MVAPPAGLVAAPGVAAAPGVVAAAAVSRATSPPDATVSPALPSPPPHAATPTNDAHAATAINRCHPVPTISPPASEVLPRSCWTLAPAARHLRARKEAPGRARSVLSATGQIEGPVPRDRP